jgi:DNA-binding winged helix-turn-helix (wHTH) protein
VTFHFGEFTVDAGARRVLRAGGPVHLSPKAFDLLVALVHERPRVLSKEDLHQRLWPDTFVSDASLAMLVAEVRAAIGDSAREPRWVRTVHRRGYAFQAADSIDVVARPAAGAASPPAREHSGCCLVDPQRRFTLAPGPNIVGRDPECEVWIDSPGVSRRHARVVVEGGRVTVDDLGSKNGTIVRGRAVKMTTLLTDGDDVRFGSARLTFRAWAAGPTLTEGGS